MVIAVAKVMKEKLLSLSQQAKVITEKFLDNRFRHSYQNISSTSLIVNQSEM